jgi:hypothetical protein
MIPKKITTKPSNTGDCDTLFSWINSEKELTQWAGPVLFSWPFSKAQLFTYLARTLSLEETQ